MVVTESPGSASLGVSSPAKIRRTFAMLPGDVAAGIETLADDARDAGWTLRDREAGGYDGDKTIDGLFARIVITGIDNDNVLWVEISTNDS